MGNPFGKDFYWPTAIADTNKVVRTHERC
jgi:hypothetical protein